MKKILFVINSLTIGGSEKSLVSLLNCIDYNQYQVDLLMFKKGEDFDKYIPKEVNILDIPDYYKFLNKEKIKIKLSKKIKFILCRLNTSLELRKGKRLQAEQILYNNQKIVLKNLKEQYDVAIAYSQGMPTYFIAEKVNANKKLAWINCDYKITGYDKDLDYTFYKKIDKIIAVSKYCKESIVSVNKEYEKKTEVILDIVNPKLIQKMANEEEVFTDKTSINILTVARLIIHYKGYDIAIKAAKLLKDDGYNFKWFVVGEGYHRKDIEDLIEKNGLEDNFILLGKKINPYPYMKNCDIYVQPSRKEGFGLTVVEAKILNKPIVCTKFETSKEIINNEEDGLVVGINAKELYLGIKRYLDDIEFKNKIEHNLYNEEKYTSIEEINKIYKLIN